MGKGTLKHSFASCSSSSLTLSAQSVGICLGSTLAVIKANVNQLKQLETERMISFHGNYPDMFLPNENELLTDNWLHSIPSEDESSSVDGESAEEDFAEQALAMRSGRGKNKIRRKAYDRSFLEC